ncbi:MAG: lysophospholipid acyltransferase family protein [Planctomycetota bacterium]|nr:lysophospholipid acyltransferase family protein [Planctomycetota bacterium]MDA1105570.1 lysophospholipid acyltransferase family protein [Planctomycetota bacterium]
MTRVADLAQYAALRGAFALFHSFPVSANLRTARAVARAYMAISAKHRVRGRRHLRAAFPEATEAWVQQTNLAAFQHLLQLFMVEAMQTPRLINHSSWHRHVSVNAQDGALRRALQLLAQGRPAIFITGHCGSWELLGFVLSLLGLPMVALARPLDNPYLNRWIMGVREARGLRILTKFGASKEAVQILRSGGRVGFIADQDAGMDGVFVPFFGRLASAYKSIALLAMTQEVPIIVGGAFRDAGGFHYRLEVDEVIEPEAWSHATDPLYWLTARYTASLERMVRRHPDQYLWIHRRWKSRPRHEREGVSMPTRLEAKLRELDWLSPSEADAIISRSAAATGECHAA